MAAGTGPSGSRQAGRQPHQPDKPPNLSHLGFRQRVEILPTKHLGLRVARHLLLFGAFGRTVLVEDLQLPASDRDRGAPIG